MSEKEKELKSFNQCADALSVLDKRSILKVFHMLSIHFEVVPFLENSNDNKNNFNNNIQDSIEDEVFLEAPKKTAQKKVAVSTTAKKSKISSKDLTYLTDYDFRPAGVEGVKEFYEKYKSTSNMENNLIFAYYFQEKRQEKEISTDLIYSAYRHIGLKIPSFPQSLFDTKARKGWIETANMHELKVTRAGINFIEHEIGKAND